MMAAPVQLLLQKYLQKKKVPLLTTVSLDGSILMDSWNVPSWRNQLRTLVIDTLSISNFQPLRF
jgi:hypothetical protein